MNPTLDLTLVIPCFNEAAGIRNTLETVVAYVRGRAEIRSFEVIPIDDGSRDRTGDALRELAERHVEIRPIHFDRNRGRGAALKAGFAASRGNTVIPLDADLSYDVGHIGDILDAFARDPKTDLVVVSPYMKGGTVVGVPFQRLLISRVANWILAGFFAGRLSTVTCVVRGYRGTLIRGLRLLEEGKELHLEILRKAALLEARIVEIPGRLRWSGGKARARRPNNVQVVSSGKKHLTYGLLIRPTRVLKYVTALLFAIAAYEGAVLFNSFVSHYEDRAEFVRNVWFALSATFQQSPHTVVITSVAMLLGFQSLTFLILLKFLKLQQEETMRHLVVMMADRSAED